MAILTVTEVRTSISNVTNGLICEYYFESILVTDETSSCEITVNLMFINYQQNPLLR